MDAATLKGKLGDATRRLNTLYHIKNERGKDVIFKMRPPQRAFWENRWFLSLILKGRQIGFSTLIALYFLDSCLFKSNIAAGIVDKTLDDAKKKLAKVKYAYDNLPPELRGRKPLVKDSASSLEWANGSTIEVGVSHRGATLQMLHVSEMGKIAAEHPERAKEIRTGAFGTVHKGQFICVESTAEGIGGEFHDLTKRARELHEAGAELTPMDFKFFFYPWQDHPDYWLNANVVIGEELRTYFDKLEAEHGIQLSDHRKAWYAKTLEQLNFNWSDMFREYPSIPDEPFIASIEGAYFQRQMLRMRQDGRLGKVPHDPSRPVNTFWDIGVDDATAIWFHQTDGVRHRLIHYYENSGETVDHYAHYLQELAQAPGQGTGRGFRYGKHYGPHDLGNQNWALPGNKTVKDIAREQGLDFEVVPKIANKQDAIEAARSFLPMTWIDEEHCQRGVQCLDSYQKQWNDRLATWRKEPLHNWASHCADALQTGACGISPGNVPGGIKSRYSRSRPYRASAWTA